LTEVWHDRFHSKWAVVAGSTEIGEPLTFYSADHPVPFTPGELWSSGLTSLEEAKRLGFIGVCETTDYRIAQCEKWMAENAVGGEQLVMTTQRFFGGHPGPAIVVTSSYPPEPSASELFAFRSLFVVCGCTS